MPSGCETEVHAFADDSITEEVIVCAAAVFSAKRVKAAEDALAEAKKSIGISPETVLHCRVIFSGDARRGTEWESIDPKGIYDMVGHLCESLRPLGHKPLVAVIDPRQVPPLPVAPGVPNREPTEKAIASLAYSAVSNGLVRVHGPATVRLWIDPDSTRIPWGAGHRRADRTRSMFIDLGPGHQPLEVVPQVLDSPKPRLLELADVYAYVTAQAHSQRGGQRMERFRTLYRIIEPGQWSFSFPAASSEWHSTAT